MNDNVIEARGLRRTFRKAVAVDGLDLSVPQGSVFGFIGRNGAGKTTTIKMLLGLLPPTSGEATVLGQDSTRRGLEIRREVGYVPEQHHLYRWMKISELMWFLRPFYPTWDDTECDRLLKHFDLDPNQKIKELSKGMVAKVALTIALAHRPKILVLDEPTGGLDVIVRREFLESIVQLIEEGDRTVFISSHLLADVERVADHVAILNGGRLLTQETMDSLKGRVRQIRLRFGDSVPERIEEGSVLRAERHNHEWIVTTSNFTEDLASELKQRLSAEAAEVIDLGLEDIFIELVGQRIEGE